MWWVYVSISSQFTLFQDSYTLNNLRQVLCPYNLFMIVFSRTAICLLPRLVSCKSRALTLIWAEGSRPTRTTKGAPKSAGGAHEAPRNYYTVSLLNTRAIETKVNMLRNHLCAVHHQNNILNCLKRSSKMFYSPRRTSSF